MTMLTVLTPATGRDLTTLAQIKSELSLTDGADDVWVADAISRVSVDIARFCNRTFGLEQMSETFRLRQPADKLMLARFPVVLIDSIVEGGTSLIEGQWEADTASGMLYRLDAGDTARWCAGKVTVTYTAGYRLPGDPLRDLPGDIETATVEMIKAMWFRRSRDPAARSEAVQGVSTIAYRDAFPAEVERLLFQHRAIPIG